MPDVFVPLDTTLYTDYHRDMVAKGTMSQFAMKYIDKHRKSLEKKYKTVASYIANFEVDDKMMTQLKEAGDADKVEYDAEEAAKSRDMMSRQIKALIARDLFDMSAYFQVMNPIDPVYLKGIEIINNDEEYRNLLER